jgi:DNA-binding CsgD family transcriptional regulator
MSVAYNEQQRIAAQLEAIQGRFEELSIRITLPEVIADTALFTTLMRQHSELSELNDVAVAYKKLLDDIEGAKEMLSDPDMAELAREELAELEPKLERMAWAGVLEYNWENPQPSESKPRRGVKPSIWTPRRTAELIRLAQAGLRTDEIADRIHLALNQVKPKMAELRKKGEIPPAPPQKNSWRKEENDKLIQLYQQGYTTEKIAAALGRTEHAVGSQIHNLRKRGVDVPARPDVHRKPAPRSGND